MDKNLALEFVRVTEAAAIASAHWVGRGQKNKADGAAVSAMRERFNLVDFRGTVVIGEGAKDEAPMLYTGEKVGSGKGPEMDLAIDPLECTDSVANGRYNAMAVIAAGAKGSLLHAPDTYMDKIAVGQLAKKVIDLDASVKDNLKKVAKAVGKSIADITVMVLDRERHQQLIDEIRSAGARVRLITDGDVSAAVATCFPESGVDVMMGIGGSTEGVLAAVAIKVLGGEILCRFKPRKESDIVEIKKTGLKDLNKIFTSEDMAKGRELSFTATGVIEGPMLEGVLFREKKIITHSVVARGVSGTIRYITTHHHYYK
ncbi:MAG: Fructose-1,6-bisphosphatase [Candidatus Roizmanbacteria bacterium GW2011_GWA2_35_19]|uniref:Fructose-1,6-bisphosphatase n=2 Tax=Candidatus Roizmaniibacteriota TaxID=1752723 RepID=A0A0G0BQA8_9BACT|nr:MAG: Fructose-1,6-bisphosphatase [Candidatus Roizmanbacteria bacterium GW2011_GWC2_35_12]KKP71704.1 MAG: Fructose-1,6-bisphosphatase [Candidatus Roizmanbacteria bacterium GW2011_GWA2_35_19]